MGVSFKVNRTGSRYRHRPPPPESPAEKKPTDHETFSVALGPKGTDGEGGPDLSVSSASRENNHAGTEHEASFCLKLFPDGFSIGKPTEGMLLPLLEEMPKLLHPYDRGSKTLFSAIEHGWLPGDLLDDIPCKFFNGSLICEVLDYRRCTSRSGNDNTIGDDLPKVQKVCLRMGMETVIKDMPAIADDSWTYNDLLEAEARIIKALQPVLVLGTNPSLDGLCSTTVSKQLDLGIYERRQTRTQKHIQETNSNITDLSNGKDTSSNPCDCSSSLPINEAPTNCNGLNLLEKRNRPFKESTPVATIKKPKLEPVDFDSCRVDYDSIPTHVKQDARALNIRCDKFNQHHPLSYTKALPPHLQWTNTGPSIDKFTKKDNTSRKRKLSQGTQVIAADSDHGSASQLAANPRMPPGAPHNKCPTGSVVSLQKDDIALNPAASVGITVLPPSSSNSLMQESLIPDTKARPKSHYTVTPQSLAPMQPPPDVKCIQDIIERFSKIIMVAERHGLDKQKKKKTDVQLVAKSLSTYYLPPIHLLMADDNVGCQPLTEKNCMSKFLIGGNRNTFKTRISTFLRTRHFFRGQAAPLLLIESMKLVLSESDSICEGGVGAAVIYGDDGRQVPISILPTPHHADLFAAQFTSMMRREGYELVDDQLQPTLAINSDPSNTTFTHTIPPGVVEPCTGHILNQSLKMATPLSNFTSAMNPMQQKQYQSQNPLPLVWSNSSSITSTRMGSQMPKNLTCPQNLFLAQSRRMAYHQTAIMQGTMANLGVTSYALGTLGAQVGQPKPVKREGMGHRTGNSSDSYSQRQQTRLSHVKPMSPKQLKSSSTAHQVNADQANMGSPKVNSPTVGSGGSITSSPMELNGTQKGSCDGDDVVK